MTRLCAIGIGIALLFQWGRTTAQTNMQTIGSLRIQVAANKTSNFIFPFSIKSVDRGSSDVVVQIAPGADSVLQLKAARPNMEETNLTVITADGELFSFLLTYSPSPAVLNYRLRSVHTVPQEQAAVTIPPNEATLKAAAEALRQVPSFMNHTTSDQKVRLHLGGIYLKAGAMWFGLVLDNRSSIDYRLQHFRVFLRDRKRSKRTAVQERELKPLYLSPQSGVVGHHAGQIVLGLQPLTFPKDKEMIIEIAEQGNGRLLQLQVPSRWLLKARHR